jgi:glutaredoxin-like protein
MLAYINPKADKPADITVFTKRGCPFCARAKGMLADYGYAFEEVQLDRSVTMRSVRAVTGRDTVPQVFVNGEYVGGSEALEAWIKARHQDAA